MVSASIDPAIVALVYYLLVYRKLIPIKDSLSGSPFMPMAFAFFIHAFLVVVYGFLIEFVALGQQEYIDFSHGYFLPGENHSLGTLFIVSLAFLFLANSLLSSVFLGRLAFATRAESTRSNFDFFAPSLWLAPTMAIVANPTWFTLIVTATYHYP